MKRKLAGDAPAAQLVFVAESAQIGLSSIGPKAVAIHVIDPDQLIKSEHFGTFSAASRFTLKVMKETDMKRLLIAGAASALVIGTVAIAQSPQQGAAANDPNATSANSGSMSNDAASSTSGAGTPETTSGAGSAETTQGAGSDYAATGERG